MEWMGEMMDAPTWMGESQQLEGATFGLLTVEAPAAPSADGAVQVLCRCACGRVAVRRVRELSAGRASACRRCRQPRRVEMPPPRAEGEALDWLRRVRQDPQRLARVLEEVDELVAAAVAHKGPRRAARQRQEARVAAMRRIRLMRADDILRELDAPVSHQTLYQWISRGRRYVASAIDQRLRHVAGVDRAHLKLMREVFAVGRADAGQPRFHRRKVRR